MGSESSFSFDPPQSPRSARSADKSTIVFSFDTTTTQSKAHIITARERAASIVSHKSFKSKANAENKETAWSDSCKSTKNANKIDNGSTSSSSGGSFRKERRSFKCERLSNIFKDSPNKEKQDAASVARRINSAPVFRKHPSAINQNKMNFEDDDSSSPGASDLTMFPFDREAIDYERIQRECFAVEEEFDDYNCRKSFPYDYDTEDSPSYETIDQKEGIFQQYAIISQQEIERQNKKRSQSPGVVGSVSEMKSLTRVEHINKKKFNETILPSAGATISSSINMPNLTSPIPDLKIDFFAESSLTASRFVRENENENSGALLDGCQLDTTSTSPFNGGNSSKSTTTNNNTTSGSINLTSNPMSTAVCTPRATIVVQQVCFAF